MRSERTILFHYHLFKNAGTSVDALLKMNFPDRWVTREFPRAPDINRSQVVEWIKDHPDAVCFSSHTAHLPPPEIPGIRVIPLIFVRDPLDRIASAYSFERKQPGDRPGAALARNTTLAGYIEARLASPEDRQCRDFQTARFARMIPAAGGTELERALEAARILPFVGVVEDFPGSMRRLRRLLRKEGLGEFFIRPMARNVSRSPGRTLEERLEDIASQIGPDLFRRLQDANARDQELHACCTRLAKDDKSCNERGLPPHPGRSATYLFNLSEELSRRGRHRQALAAIDRAIAASPDTARLHRQRSMALDGLGRLGDAIDAIRHATTLAPGDANLWVRLGNALARTGRIDEALAAMTHAVVCAPSNANALQGHARLLKQKGLQGDALDAAEVALATAIAAARKLAAKTYALGFDERSTARIHRSDGELTWINCRRFLEDDEDTATRSFEKLLVEVKASMTDGDVILTSGEPLRERIRLALRRGHPFRLEDYDRIRRLIAQFTARSRALSLPVKHDAQSDASAGAEQEHIDWGRRFHARCGRVELRVIENHLRDHSRLQAGFVDVMNGLDDEAFMYSQGRQQHWLDSSDVAFNLRRLMTNAGFYARDAQDGACLEDWCTRYWDALLGADCLFTQEQIAAEFLVPQDFMAKLGRFTPFMPFPTPEAFYRSLASQDIVFVTPFPEEIQASAEDGRLFRLYKDIDIPRFTIRTSRAEISTYPNRPHDSWSETFTRMKHAVDRLFEERAPTLFLASCGCYGLPLCHYVHTTYGCGAVYFGNFMNTLFGIRQATSEGFLRERRRDENWSASRLGLIRNVDRIDGGRYVL